ncbi:uncharacterized protein VTP21DRAFT_10090 [Calcarisporiella thermophila]|uniref:uncharacterized protein n=1 Tax=Calcarisporiella thermophila TaxID=911321 RepID=UPI003742F411
MASLRLSVSKSIHPPAWSARGTRKLTAGLYRNYSAANAAAETPIMADPTVGPMLRFQKNLPRLPVPALADTCQKYLQTVRPLLSDEDYAKTRAAVEEFQRQGGIGEELQRRLLAKANDPNVVNWLEDWWNEVAYFGYRDPVVVYVSYFFAYKDDPVRQAPAARAAGIVTAALDFRRQVLSQTLEPEYAKKQPLCMDSYKWMFNACRIPKKPSDYEATYDPTINNHIVVIRNNKFYVVDVVHDGKQLSTAELQKQFEHIINSAGNDKGTPIGILTADNRDNWADSRELLINASPQNKELLKKIEGSIFAVCLDDSRPTTRDEISRACWHGDGRNRFFDKSLQFIIFDNGKAGFIGEHSCMDGTPVARLNDYICEGLAKNKIDHGSPSVRSSLPAPTQLEFGINSNVLREIDRASVDFESLIDKHDLRVLAYEGYGKNLIKKFRLSPDAYVQMIIQLAYYKVNGVSRPTYESAQTRKYQHGRTETCRTVSTDSVKWVQAMADKNITPEVKAELGRRAINSHVKYMADCVEGHGVDRHLFGLRMLLRPEEPKPSIFVDPAYSYSSHWFLSTSQLSSEHFEGYGWGEVVPDGFGIAYMIKNDSLHFNVASLKTMPNAQMHSALRQAAEEMRAVFEKELKAKASL